MTKAKIWSRGLNPAINPAKIDDATKEDLADLASLQPPTEAQTELLQSIADQLDPTRFNEVRETCEFFRRESRAILDTKKAPERDSLLQIETTCLEAAKALARAPQQDIYLMQMAKVDAVDAPSKIELGPAMRALHKRADAIRSGTRMSREQAVAKIAANPAEARVWKAALAEENKKKLDEVGTQFDRASTIQELMGASDIKLLQFSSMLCRLSVLAGNAAKQIQVKPPSPNNPEKDLCAHYAYILVVEFSRRKRGKRQFFPDPPSRGRNGVYLAVAGLLYEFLTGLTRANLDRACRKVLDLHDKPKHRATG
jgi:hypothetical protein